MMTRINYFNKIRGRFSYYRHFISSASFLLIIFLICFTCSSKFCLFAVENNDRLNECQPAKKIVFMKTHKCASSTIENILFRHAVKENLNIALPAEGNYLSRTELFNRSSVLSTKWGRLPVDVFTLHNRWNYEETMALMGPSVNTFTIVRNPVEHFESVYVYTKLDSLYGVELKKFIEVLQKNATNASLHFEYFGCNLIAFDLGISISDSNSDPKVIYKRIKELDNQFNLVMIAERMDESLVLLADLLCWPLERVVHLKLNVRKPEKNIDLTEDEGRTLSRWLNIDSAIYSYFKKRFDERVTDFNARHSTPNWMSEQVRLLRDLNSKLKIRCVIQQVGNEKLSGKFQESSNDIMGYLIHQDIPECEWYAMSEPAYLSLFREKMDAQLAV